MFVPIGYRLYRLLIDILFIFSPQTMSTVKVVRGARIMTPELYGEPRQRAIRPPRKVFFKCPEPACGFEHAIWSLISQHLFHHHGYSQEVIDLEECEQRKTRRNKNWLKKKLAAMDAPSESFVDEDGNEIEEEENREVDMKPSPVVLEAMRKLLPRGDTSKDGCTCPISECSAILGNRVDLVNHARTTHIDHPTAMGNFEIRSELFENEDDFKDWKLRLESDFGMYYTCESTSRQGDCKNFFFVCHRSGRVVRRMRQLRERRQADRAAAAAAEGSAAPSPKKRNKIVKAQEYCTAFMRARRDGLGRFHIHYSTSHIGHDHQPALLPLTAAMKKIIYDRIVDQHGNASCSLIAHRIREQYNDASSRLHYVSMTDVIEVIRMERKRLAKVGGVEAEEAHEIFRVNCKKGRRKMGQELLSSGERHKPPRVGGRRREEIDMGDKTDIVHMHDYSRQIKLDVDDIEEEEEEEMVDGEEGVMDDDHGAYYDDEEIDVDVHGHPGFVVDDDEVDDSMLESSQQEEEEEDVDVMPHLAPSSSSRVVAVRPVQRGLDPQHGGVVMEDVVRIKHEMDEHVDNICEALVRNGDPHALQAYLDAIRNVSARYEHLLGR